MNGLRPSFGNGKANASGRIIRRIGERFAPGEAFQFDWSADCAYVGGARIKLRMERMRWMPPPDGIECAKVVSLEPR